MAGLTAKVFRTYNASWTFVQQLKDTPQDASVADKILAYNRANRLVAVLCNHQRSVSKGHSVAMEKMADKVRSYGLLRREGGGRAELTCARCRRRVDSRAQVPEEEVALCVARQCREQEGQEVSPTLSVACVHEQRS